MKTSIDSPDDEDLRRREQGPVYDDKPQAYYDEEFNKLAEQTRYDRESDKVRQAGNPEEQEDNSLGGRAGDALKEKAHGKLLDKFGLGGEKGEGAKGKLAGQLGDGFTGATPLKSVKKFGGKKWIIGAVASSGLLVTLLTFVFVVSLLGNFRTVHFATLLRSIAMVRFNYYSQKQWARITFDAATLTADSKGHFDLKDRSLSERLRGVNPDKWLRKLGRDGTLRFQFDQNSSWGGLKKTNAFKGVVIEGQPITVDEFAKKYGYATYSDIIRDTTSLNPKKALDARRTKLGVEAQFTNAVRGKMDTIMAGESLRMRSSVYNGLRQAAGIRMTKWANKAREFIGKKPDEARKLNIDETVEAIKGGSGRVASGSDEFNKEADDYAKETLDAAEQGKKPGEVRSKIAARLNGTISTISNGVFVTTSACIIHDLAGSFAEADKQQELRAYRLGHDALTGGDQLKTGQGVPEAARAEADRWKNGEQSAVLRQAAGKPLSGSDIKQINEIPSIVPSSTMSNVVQYADAFLFQGSISSSLFNAIGLGGLTKKVNDVGCSIILNQYVQYTVAGVEVVITVVSFGASRGITEGIVEGLKASFKLAAGVALSDYLGHLIDHAIKQYAGYDYSGLQTGPELVNQSAVGVDLLQQNGIRQINFGRPGTDQEIQSSQQLAMADIRAQNRQAPFAQRYFALDNPYSLSSSLLASLPASLVGLASSVRSGIASLASTSLLRPLSYIGSAFSSQANAAIVTGASTGHGVKGWVFTSAEWNRIETDTAFAFETNADYVESRYDALNAKYAKCYNFELQSQEPKDGDQPYCTAALLGSDEALHWRWYMAERCGADFLTSGNLDNNGMDCIPPVPA